MIEQKDLVELLQSGVKQLKISSFLLNSFSENNDIESLKRYGENLESLDFSSLNFVELGKSIPQLIAFKNLKTLKFIGCGLSSFPSLEVLKDTLEFLDLSSNSLVELPASNFLPIFSRLKILFLTSNNFTSYPEILTKHFPLVDMISFRYNKLHTIKENSISPLMRWLILTGNQLEVLPSDIGNCTRLQKFLLSGNKLHSLPISMASCHNLELLRLSGNQFVSFPDWLFTLPRLSWLGIGANPCPWLSSVDISGFHSIDWNELQLKDKIGEGASGVIHEAIYQSNKVAVKLFKSSLTTDGFPEDEMKATLLVGDHNNIIKVKGIITSHPNQTKGIVLELIPPEYKSLGNPPSFSTCTRDVYRDDLKFTLEQSIKILTSVCDAVYYCTKKKILNGDLYAHNTLIDYNTNDDKVNVVIGDFGAAVYYNREDDLLERIEVSAFGKFIEDIIGLLTEEDKNNILVNKLILLQQSCTNEIVKERPLFNQIFKELNDITEIVSL